MVLPTGPEAISVKGRAIPYEQEGTGQPIVFVHGMVTDHGMWERPAHVLSQHFRVIRPTLSYFGTSPWPDKARPNFKDRP